MGAHLEWRRLVQRFDCHRPGASHGGDPLVQRADRAAGGGRDKNLPWEDFAALVHQRVDHLVLFGEAAELVQRAVGAVEPSRRPYTLERLRQTLEQAVQAAARVAEAGDVVLLSPGGTSFDEFRDFEERGEAYRKWVLELA